MNVGFVDPEYTQDMVHCLLKIIVRTFTFVDLSVKNFLNWEKILNFWHGVLKIGKKKVNVFFYHLDF
jgi:hypothetical protein